MTVTEPASNDTTASMLTRRRLVVRDTLTFLTLTLITAALSLVTWFLFRSFTSHREDLAHRWSARGRLELNNHHPEEAVTALRTALSYDPESLDDELLLAEALGAAGHTEEATNYFLGLWETRPGDGFINLQLARLARKGSHVNDAINYYRASIFGNWGEQGVERRRDVRLELASYLIDQRQIEEARAELLLAGTNNPGDLNLAIRIGDLLQKAQDPRNALAYYQRALRGDPNNLAALDRASHLAYDTNDYRLAHSLSGRAVELSARPGQPSLPDRPELEMLLNSSDRILALNISHDQPARIRSEHLLAASAIATKRLDACIQSTAPPGSGLTPPPQLLALTADWAPLITRAGHNTIAHDPETQDNVADLIRDTEADTAQFCGKPTGDDALLLRLTNASSGPNQ